MKPVYYLAVDIGASSGRHILASMDNGRMTIEEVNEEIIRILRSKKDA